MKIINNTEPLGFDEIKDHDVIDRINVNFNYKRGTIHFHDGTACVIPMECSSFNSQYGFPISDDGEIIIVNCWDKGIHVFETKTGELLWKTRTTGYANIIIFDNTVVAHKLGSKVGVYKFDLFSGEELGKVTGPSIDTFKQLRENYFLAFWLRGTACVIDVNTMEIYKKVSIKELNPKDCLALSIHKAYCAENNLILEGWECYPHKNYIHNDEGTKFIRVFKNFFLNS